MAISRRRFFRSAVVASAAAPMGVAFFSYGQEAAFGLVPDADFDQTETLQLAIEASASSGGRMFLPAGQYRTSTLRVPPGVILDGIPGRTWLSHTGQGPLLLIEEADDVSCFGIGIDGNGAGGDIWHGGLVHVVNSANLLMRDCRVRNTGLNAISLLSSSGTVEGCIASEIEYTGIFIHDGQDMRISGNRIFGCGNGGIRIWRSSPGFDGALVFGNAISDIDWRAGGNGQNGNGINIFQADGVIIANNSISDCAFSAIRLNATNNTNVTSNTCTKSGEVAIFSEFGFSGSVIADNIVDGASGGISITNFNDGGRLAACTGNIVRNLTEGSKTNPDLDRPYGIAAEADAVVANNVVENVAGTGIVAGWGPYLRDVSITGNLIRDADTGIAVSVAPEAGSATIAGNTVSGARNNAIAGVAWWDVATPDLMSGASDHPQLSIGANTVL